MESGCPAQVVTGRYDVKAEAEVTIDACQIQIINVGTEYGPAPSMLLACNARMDQQWENGKDGNKGKGVKHCNNRSSTNCHKSELSNPQKIMRSRLIATSSSSTMLTAPSFTKEEGISQIRKYELM